MILILSIVGLSLGGFMTFHLVRASNHLQLVEQEQDQRSASTIKKLESGNLPISLRSADSADSAPALEKLKILVAEQVKTAAEQQTMLKNQAEAQKEPLQKFTTSMKSLMDNTQQPSEETINASADRINSMLPDTGTIKTLMKNLPPESEEPNQTTLGKRASALAAVKDSLDKLSGKFDQLEAGELAKESLKRTK